MKRGRMQRRLKTGRGGQTVEGNGKRRRKEEGRLKNRRKSKGDQ